PSRWGDPSHWSKRRRRFWLKVDASHGCSPRLRPANQRNAMLHCSSITSLLSLVTQRRYPPTRARSNCSGGIDVQIAAGAPDGAVIDKRTNTPQGWSSGTTVSSGDVVEQCPLRVRRRSHHWCHLRHRRLRRVVYNAEPKRTDFVSTLLKLPAC